MLLVPAPDTFPMIFKWFLTITSMYIFVGDEGGEFYFILREVKNYFLGVSQINLKGLLVGLIK